MKIQALLLLPLLLLGCGSNPESSRPTPPWISQTTRTVDNGYIVYIGGGEEVSQNDAELAAEGMALQDLANECTFVPKGARVEDRYSEKQKNTFKAYAKVAVEFQLCDDAAKTTDPEKIKLLASLPFTEELKKFEDRIQQAQDTVTQDVAEEDLKSPGYHIEDPTRYVVMRQFVVYRNVEVIMSPPTAYAPGSSETQYYAAHVQPVAHVITNYASSHPEVVHNPPTWSSVAPKYRENSMRRFARPRNGGAKREMSKTAQPQQPRKRRKFRDHERF